MQYANRAPRLAREARYETALDDRTPYEFTPTVATAVG